MVLVTGLRVGFLGFRVQDKFPVIYFYLLFFFEGGGVCFVCLFWGGVWVYCYHYSYYSYC